MYTGNPHQDPRGLDRRGHKSFTSGWESGWNDFKDNRDLQGPMNPGGQLPRPNPWNGKPFPKGHEPNHMIPMDQTAGFDPGNRRPIYDRNGNLVPQRPVLGDRNSTVPIPLMDYVGNRTAMNKGLDNWGGNLGGTFRLPGYGDPDWEHRWGPSYTDEYYDDDLGDADILDFNLDGPLSFT
jgi:hypothetical protein